MSEQSARIAEPRTPGMHLGRRFGDVLVSWETDVELTWFFNDHETESNQPCVLPIAFSGRNPCSLGEAEARIEAAHAGRKIWGRLESLGARDARVLETLYTDRVWPGALVRRFGPVVAVVEGLVRVRAEQIHARMKGRTTATSTVAWLQEQVARSNKELATYREEAVIACEQAVGAYQRARGNGRSVVPTEDR